jgi:hypothetical protein
MSDANALLKSRRKLVALKRAEFALKQRFEKIDFELDVLRPQIEELESLAAQGQLPEFSIEDPS